MRIEELEKLLSEASQSSNNFDQQQARMLRDIALRNAAPALIELVKAATSMDNFHEYECMVPCDCGRDALDSALQKLEALK